MPATRGGSEGAATGGLRGRLDTDGLGRVHWVAVALALLSGVVHLVLGVGGVVAGETVGLAVSFVLAGLAFFGAVALLLLGVRRRLLYAVGVPFVAVQTVTWYWLNYGATGDSLPGVSPVEAVDKVAQTVLVVLLVYLYRRE